MKILGNRILVSKIEEEKTEGFETVSPTDSFLFQGKIEQIPIDWHEMGTVLVGPAKALSVGLVVLFAKYSPDTHDVEVDGKKMKIVSVADVLAVL